VPVADCWRELAARSTSNLAEERWILLAWLVQRQSELQAAF
jgi:hypothetical protein